VRIENGLTGNPEPDEEDHGAAADRIALEIPRLFLGVSARELGVCRNTPGFFLAITWTFAHVSKNTLDVVFCLYDDKNP